ncbi:hypothetical protein M23134_05099 [Microscilla marina ATCC 23134]|uniref:Uncharacterized protein n=1 Tax=Microscilla marina ATCC 23134 TaxID=313606 RepID=A1ZD54_MICM2|nr:hypothetical protein M23134_05099 [Microscilla marina ATCC 23134]
MNETIILAGFLTSQKQAAFPPKMAVAPGLTYFVLGYSSGDCSGLTPDSLLSVW